MSAMMQMEHTASAFRAAMRRIASSVALVTARDSAGAVHGMAATAVISVSMDPPSMLVAVNRSAGIHDGIGESGCFCINILGNTQQDLIPPFSTTALRDQRFASREWREGPDGVPYLPTAVCALFCTLDQSTIYGTHTVYIGRVTRVELDQDGSPLVWLGGAPRSLEPAR
jgi:flavin reductase (DIM6/NTAB) family NADH-FMN oxidoreductase RutF